MKNFDAQQRWAQLVMEYIKSSKFRYIVAFGGAAKREDIEEMIRKLEMRIKEYEPSLTDLRGKLFLLSLRNGEMHNYSLAKDYLN